jgi:osmoprotectant transport system substrate-binding protein
MSSSTRKRVALGAVAIGLTAALVGCAQSNPLDTGDVADDNSITIGSQGFPESEILAQIYGQVLADAGYTVDYNLSIGAREVFIPALADGSIDLIPDYAGNLLYGADTAATATSTEDVVAALPAALKPLGLEVLDAAAAEDADALVVTPEYSASKNVTSIGDLAALEGKFTLGANTEFEGRSYGRPGLEEVYGVKDFTFKAIDDFGGAGTLKDLLDGVIQVADIYTTTPSIKQNNLVVLEDPEDLIAAQNVIPLLDADINNDKIAKLLNAVSAKLTTEGLLELNEIYAGDSKPSAQVVATGWLTENGFISE